MSEDARGQANFYGETTGTPEAIKVKIMHLALNVAGSNTSMFADSFQLVSYNLSISLSLNYDDETEARKAYAKLSEVY